MPALLKELCDAIFDSLDSPSDDFQNKVREVFCKMDEEYKSTSKGDIKRAEKLCAEVRHILVILRFFPIEFKLAMNNLYKKTLCGFLSIYLDFKMMLIDQQDDKEAFLDTVMREIFLLLSEEDKICIWGVVVTSHALNRLELLRSLTMRCIKDTQKCTYDYEQYIRMIWVVHVFFTQSRKFDEKKGVSEVLQAALRIIPPKGLCNWMCHHFGGFGWKGLSDEEVHHALLVDKHPKGFFREVFTNISKDDTLKYNPDSRNGNGSSNHDDSSQCSDSKSSKVSQQVPESLKPKEAKDDNIENDEHDSDDNPKEDVFTIEKDEDEKSERAKSEEASDASGTEVEGCSEREEGEKDTKSKKKLGTNKKTNDKNESPGPRSRSQKSKPVIDDDDDDTIDGEMDVQENGIKDAEAPNKKEEAESSDNDTEKPSTPSIPEKVEARETKRKRKISQIANETGSETEVDSDEEKDRRKRKKEVSKVEKNKDEDVKDKKSMQKKKKETRRKEQDEDEDKSEDEQSEDKTEEEQDDDKTEGEQDEDELKESQSTSRRVTTRRVQPEVQPRKGRGKENSKTSIEKVDEVKEERKSEKEKEKDKLLEERQKRLKAYMNGPYRHVLEKFEDDTKIKGEPVILLQRIELPQWEVETSLADKIFLSKRGRPRTAPKNKRKARYSGK